MRSGRRPLPGAAGCAADAGRGTAQGLKRMINREVIDEAYASLRHNQRRTALTMIGMAWGIATVVLLLAYGSGFERAIETIFANFGNKIIRVWPGRTQ